MLSSPQTAAVPAAFMGVFGVLQNSELFCADARVKAAQALRAYHASHRAGIYLTVGVYTAIWLELARPAAVHALHGAVEPTSEAKLFWAKASPTLKQRAVEPC